MFLKKTAKKETVKFDPSPSWTKRLNNVHPSTPTECTDECSGGGDKIPKDRSAQGRPGKNQVKELR